MGYTHYWYRPRVLEQDTFERFTNDCTVIVKRLSDRPASIMLAGPHGLGKPEITPDHVAFNGIRKGDLWHESFIIDQAVEPSYPQVNKHGWLFDFCKTARKPYDVAVVACLVRLAYHFPEAVEIDSDGEPVDWELGLTLCRDLFGLAMLPPEIKEYAAR